MIWVAEGKDWYEVTIRTRDASSAGNPAVLGP